MKRAPSLEGVRADLQLGSREVLTWRAPDSALHQEEPYKGFPGSVWHPKPTGKVWGGHNYKQMRLDTGQGHVLFVLQMPGGLWEGGDCRDLYVLVFLNS